MSRDSRLSEEASCSRSMNQDDEERCGADDDDSGIMIHNKYLDSLKLLKKNKLVIDRLTRQLSLIEKETSSIASELDKIETKISPMLSQHTSYSCGDDTTATCTSTTLSKTHSPERNESPRGGESVHRYINLSDAFDGECLLGGEMDSVSGLFTSDLSSIGKCPSFENVSVKHDDHDQVEVFIRRDGWHSVDGSNVQDLIKNRLDADESFMVSACRDDLSEVSGLSEIAQEENHWIESNDDLVLDPTSSGGSVDAATFKETGRKSHLYAFPEDACCLFGEPSQDLTIPASAEQHEDDAPCFAILGIKNRNEEDECGCILC